MAERHTLQRLTAAQWICKDNWGTSSPPFFIGGGGQCDVYGFYVAEGTIGAAKLASLGAFLGTNDRVILPFNPQVHNPPLTERICLRIPRATLSASQKETLIAEEAHWRAKMRTAGICGVQLEIKHDLTFNNELRSPYIALVWAEGKPLKWNDNTPARQEDRKKVIRQLVEMQLSMLSIRQKGYSATKYMQDLINTQIGRITEPGAHSSSSETMHHVQKTLLNKHIIPELDDGPSVLVHGDLGEGNIIVDENHNVTLIGLGHMHQEPLQLSAYFPRFLTHEPSSVASNCPIAHRIDIVGWSGAWGQTESAQLAKDRKYYLDHVKAVAERKVVDHHGRVDEELMKFMKSFSEVLHRADEVERFWWIQAMHRVDTWLHMERCEWEPRMEKREEIGVDVEGVAVPLSKSAPQISEAVIFGSHP